LSRSTPRTRSRAAAKTPRLGGGVTHSLKGAWFPPVNLECTSSMYQLNPFVTRSFEERRLVSFNPWNLKCGFLVSQAFAFTNGPNVCAALRPGAGGVGEPQDEHPPEVQRAGDDPGLHDVRHHQHAREGRQRAAVPPRGGGCTSCVCVELKTFLLFSTENREGCTSSIQSDP
jgi:hypothetical protein